MYLASLNSDWEYINDYEKFTEQVKRFEQVFLEQGLEKGIEQDKDNEKFEAGLKGIKAGYPNEIIKTITGLTDEQINNLREGFRSL